jgi:hypothetical protein
MLFSKGEEIRGDFSDHEVVPGDTIIAAFYRDSCDRVLFVLFIEQIKLPEYNLIMDCMYIAYSDALRLLKVFCEEKFHATQTFFHRQNCS